ncbi:MAG TPA: tetratricopeptide repeat protein, partial [Methanoregulaceae archaeon]|nr:tetratricopeptide repeat protein [Methanoregulaceae archaeon]
EKALTLSSTYPKPLYNRCVCLADLGRFEESLASYDACIRINPGVSVVHANRGVTHAGLERYQEALEAFEEALRLDPEDITALNNICLLLSRLRRDNEAIEYHARASRGAEGF